MSVVIFTANDSLHGTRLWATDGTSADTAPVLLSPSPGPFTVVDGVAYFWASDGVSTAYGTENKLWRTDGTAAGTYAIGTGLVGAGSPPSLIGAGGKVFYIGSDANHREALFASDGTHPGQFVGALNSDPTAAFNADIEGAVGSRVILRVSQYLWVSDGTSAGTHLLDDGEAGSKLFGASSPQIVNGRAYFTADDGIHGAQLWSTDGVTATSVTSSSVIGLGMSGVPSSLPGELIFVVNTGGGAQDLRAWDGSAASSTTLISLPHGIYSYGNWTDGGKYYFTSTDPNTSGQALFVTDGTAAGTFEVARGAFQSGVKLGANYVLTGSNGIYVSDGTPAGTTFVVGGANNLTTFTQAGGEVFFSRAGATSTELWESDGTLAGTHLVKSGLASISNITVVDGQVLFSASTDGINVEPWVSDGTAAGTHQLADINPLQPGALTVSGEVAFGAGVAYVGTTPALGLPGTMSSLWISDGTVAGTKAVSIGSSGGLSSSVSSPPIIAGGNLYIDYTQGSQTHLWVLAAGANTPVDLQAAIGFQTLPTDLTAFNGKLFFFDNQVLPAFGAGGLFSTDGTSAGTTLVKAFTAMSQPVAFNGALAFVAASASDGSGLFVSDGTAAGTHFVAALPTDFAALSFTASGSKLFFTAGSLSTGRELWVSDGTGGGTHLVADIAPGAAAANIGSITAFNGGVVFTADDQTHGAQLWFSDGSAAGTVQFDINQTHDATTSMLTSGGFSFGGKTYLVGSVPGRPDTLVASDGTAAGTSVVTALGVGDGGGPDATFFISLGGKLLFTDWGKLFASDGTAAGTSVITGDFDTVSTPLLLDGKIYFGGSQASNPTTAGIFVSDGTTAGTHKVADVGGVLTVAGDSLFYFGDDQTHGQGIFAYNAISGATTFIKSVTSFTNSSGALGVAVNGKLVFATPSDVFATAVWASDGTAAGTTFLTGAPQGSLGFFNFTAFNGEDAFTSIGSSGGGLWLSDGTAAGTHMVFSGSIENFSLTPIGSLLYFLVDGATTGQLWVYDPAHGSATQVDTGAVASNPSDITRVGTGAYFVADDATSSNELWHIDSAGHITEVSSASNGAIGNGLPLFNAFAALNGGLIYAGDDTVHGTGVYFAGAGGVSFLAHLDLAQNFTVIGGLAYFEGQDSTNGVELWVTNGTSAGTHRLTDTEAPNGAAAAGFATLGGRLYFTANDGVHGAELWSLDSGGGASLVTDLNPGAAGSSPTSLTVMGGALYCVANNGAGASELWRSDGTAAGTTAVTTAANGAGPASLTVDGSELFFFGSDSTHGSGLFVSDGTAAGTHFLHGFTAVDSMTISGGHVYFRGADATNGSEFWTSDGTVAGTTKLSATGVDPGSNPGGYVALGTSTAPAVSDFNADGKSDVLFERADGTLATWQLNNTAIAGGGTLGSPGSAWRLAGSGDFNGDGRADELFQKADGTLATWQLNGTTNTGGGTLGNPGAGWSEAGIGDFNGDGKADVLFQRADGTLATWDLNGAAIIGGGTLGNPGAGWQVKAVADFNGDGKADVLFESAAGAFATWQLNDTAISGGGTLGSPGPGWSYAGVGDFNGDGKADVLFESAAGAYATWDIAGTSIIGGGNIGNPGSAWSLAQIGDFNGDGKSDLLFRNVDGSLATWDLNDTAIIGGGAIGNPGGGWSPVPLSHGQSFAELVFANTGGSWASWQVNGGAVVGGGTLGSPGAQATQVLGDFNGDGARDVAFQAADGSVATWLTDGAHVIGGASLGNPGAGWSLVGSGDFNGDGRSDLLFKNAAGQLATWDLHGAAIVGGGALGGPGANYVFEAVGDLNGDGKADLLFKNTATGTYAAWLMNDTQIIGGGDLGNPGGTWSFKALGDLNGDGKADMLFEDASGEYASWDLSGNQIIGGGDIGNPHGSWSFAELIDLNGDGKADILFQDAGGALASWTLNDTHITGGANLGNPGGAWHLIG